MGSLCEAGVPESTRRALCERMWLHWIRKGQTLYCEGNESARLYAIRVGRVKLLRTDLDGCEHVTGILESGDLFGFESIFDASYLNEARALTDAEVCVASGREVRDLMDEVPRVAIDLAKYLHQQLCRTRDRQLCFRAAGAGARLAGYILECLASRVEREGERAVETSGEEQPVVVADLTLKDLGGLLGLSPETVCRTLSEFRTKGILESSSAGIRIRDLPSLRRYARF
jgi:CRP/FNR family transcriptional regulator